MPERISILADHDNCKLADGVKLYFGDGADREDTNGGDAYIVWDGTSLVISGNIAPISTAGALYASTATVAYTDTSAKDLFTLPANAVVKQILVNVTTVFNDSGT